MISSAGDIWINKNRTGSVEAPFLYRCFRQVANCVSSGSGTNRTSHVEGYHIIHPRVASGILVLLCGRHQSEEFQRLLAFFETPIQSLQMSLHNKRQQPCESKASRKCFYGEHDFR
jgi:hypothetical protein